MGDFASLFGATIKYLPLKPGAKCACKMRAGRHTDGPPVQDLDWRQFKLTGAGERRTLERDLVLFLVSGNGSVLLYTNLSLVVS